MVVLLLDSIVLLAAFCSLSCLAFGKLLQLKNLTVNSTDFGNFGTIDIWRSGHKDTLTSIKIE
jgi:hypothetical protein